MGGDADGSLARVGSAPGAHRNSPTTERRTLTEVDNPGAILDCGTSAGREITRHQGVAMVRPAPVVGEGRAWRGPVGYAGRSAHQYLHLGRGSWEVSLQYASAVGVTVRAPGLRAVLPASLEPLGPYWLVGTMIVVTRSPSRDHPLPLRRACGRYVDWYRTS